MYKAFNNGEALSHLGLIRRTKFEISIGLEFLRSLAERVAQALAKLELSFTLRGITIRKAFLAEISDRRYHFLKLGDSECRLFDLSVF